MKMINKILLNVPEPAVDRKFLIRSSGLFWIFGALVLVFRTMQMVENWNIVLFGLLAVGIIIGYIKSRFILSKIARKNIGRINELSPHKDKICLFAFQSLSSYFLVIIMISFGMLLKLLPIPINYLVAIYSVIISALLFSSRVYFIDSE